MANDDLRPAAVAAGVLVVGGVFLFARNKKRSCTHLPGIWDERSKLHLTKDAQDEAIRLAKYSIREHVLSKEGYTLKDIVETVACGLRECDWTELNTDQQKQAWEGVEQIVKSEINSYNSDPDLWMAGF